MDIRNWSLDRIMQLPDCCFGRRWLVSARAASLDSVFAWDISEIALPERCVIWSVNLALRWDALSLSYIRLALGDQLPTTVAMMNALEPLFPGWGAQGAEPRQIEIYTGVGELASQLKMPVSAGGRRLVLEVLSQATKNACATFMMVVSSIPTEVPDWLYSGRV